MGISVGNFGCDECGSNDNNGVYQAEDGTYNSHCFGCDHNNRLCDERGHAIERATLNTHKEEYEMDDQLTFDDIQELPVVGVKARRIYKSIGQLYGMRGAKIDSDDLTHHYYPFHKDGKLVGYQERTVATKDFRSLGYGKQDIDLQGMEIWPNGGSRYLVITEGFLDAMAAQQMLTGKVADRDKRFVIVSLPNGSNANHILKNLKTREWVESFEKVILMLDQDKPGMDCAKKIAVGLRPGLVHIAEYSEKDACDMLEADKDTEFKRSFWDAKKYSPADIVTASSVREILSEENMVEALPYPDFAADLNMGWYGKRKGEITLFAAGTGLGKSSFFKEDMFHIMNNTEEKIGVVSLEESTRDILMGIQGLYLNKRVNLPTTIVSEEEKETSLDWLENKCGDRLVMLDHQGSSMGDDLMQKIRYLIDIGCGYIYIDHITLATAGSENTNKAIDDFMDSLLSLCKKKNAPWFGVVSHLRKTSDGKSFEEGAVPTMDDLKGSGSIKQIAFEVIMFARNMNAKTEVVRNRTDIYVKKARSVGKTGPAGSYTFDSETGRLKYVDRDKINVDDDDEENEFEMMA